MRVALTDFARQRLFDSDRALSGVDAPGFEAHIQEHAPLEELEGYAPFCKLWVYRNWTTTRVIAVPITDENRTQLRSAYEARTPEELPVLARWLENV